MEKAAAAAGFPSSTPVNAGVAVAVRAAPIPPAAVETVTDSVSEPEGSAETSTLETVWGLLPMVPEPETVPAPPLDVML